MVVKADLQRGGRLRYPARRRDVGAARLQTPAWMIVGKDDRCRPVLDGPSNYLAREHRYVADRAPGHFLIGEQPVPTVEEHDPQRLDCTATHRDAKIVDQLRRHLEQKSFIKIGAGDPDEPLPHGLKKQGGARAHYPGQPSPIRLERGRERAEFRESAIREQRAAQKPRQQIPVLRSR